MGIRSTNSFKDLTTHNEVGKVAGEQFEFCHGSVLLLVLLIRLSNHIQLLHQVRTN